ncbi:Cell wall-associated hydrolase, NlpC family [Modestobacter sp. DSM 44400]|uniref:C40 family peptidase n=1 Tax=Modestobacter sp. DSM 44400 TaxID=1550230 RepID=UPI0008992A58|nr:NlpC/P60 family protein [Modestobacter sp. DSM 44400]SDY27793.1 Cell wall-associated hydrolase, NlpC family [Modestobacter sp. DSM 44400]
MRRGRRSPSPRARLLAAAAAVLVCLGVAPGVASADPIPPSDEEIGAAQAARDTVVAKLSDLATQLAQSQARVDAAIAASDIALDGYQAKQTEVKAARVTAESTAATAEKAEADLAASRVEVAAFARKSYIEGTTSPGLQAMLDIDDPATMLERARLLAAAGGHKADVLVRFAVARRLALAADDAAQNALARAGLLERQAADALKAAEEAEAAARQEAADFAAEQTDLQDQLQQAQQDLAELEGAREAALEYARQQAAAAAAIAAAAAAENPGKSSAGEAALAAIGPGSPPAVQTAIGAALAAVGIRYAWGGGSLNGPSLGFGIDAGVVGYDCSGLTRFAYAQAGIGIPRNSRAQYATLPKVSRAALQPGDLVFWALDVHDPATIHHVALYLGNGKIVEAPHSGATVSVRSMYWPGYIGAVRPSA